MRRYVATAVLLCFALSGFAFAQGGNSQLGGVVTDPSGALMPGVTITVTNVDTSVSNTTITNESGSYNFPSLQPGPNYRVSSSLPGFQTRTVTNLNIGVAVTVRQDFQMQIANTTTTVEVSVEANELLTTGVQSVGEVLSSTRVRDLPIVGNDVLSLIGLMPGVRGDAENPVFAGVSEERINTVRDGLSVSDGRFQSGVFSTTFINPDLVGEIRIILTPVDAEMGRGNGQVIINTRSGTNRYSGTASWDVRNTALNPNTWGNNNDVVNGVWTPTQPNWSNTHHYTVSYGGPIIRNKTFFFALWDQQLQYQRNVTTAGVMTPQARNGVFRFYPGWTNGNAQAATNITSTTNNGGIGTGSRASVDFSGNPIAPTTFPSGAPYTAQLTCISVFGTVKFDGTPFTQADCPGGSILTGSWDTRRPVADPTGYIAKILAKMPEANYFGNVNVGNTQIGDGLNIAAYRFLRTRRGNQGAAVTIGTDTETDRKQINLKIDQNFNSNHKLAANWSYERNDTFSDLPNWPDGIPYYTQRYPQVFTANMTSTLSSSLLNEARFGVRYSNANIAAPHEEEFYPDKSIVEEALQYTIRDDGFNVTLNPGAGNYVFGGGANGVFNTNPGQYNGNISYLYNYADTVSWTMGKHAFKFGGEYRHTVSNGYNNIGGGGGVRIPFYRVNGGSSTTNASELNSTTTTPTLAFPSLNLNTTQTLGANRGNATNMLYFLAGSITGVSGLNWIDSAQDVADGKWEDVSTLPRKFRDTVQNELSFFWKDDWKATRSLTLNLGVRWDWYGSPYIGSGFTSTTVGQGMGLFGNNQNPNDMFSNWFRPGNLFLSGYGPNATPANALQCTSGVANPNGIPTSTCNSSLLTQIEFVGPKTPNPDKLAYPNDFNNFGPAIGFSYNTNIFGESRATTIRGGYQLTFGGSGRVVGGGGANATETVIGAAPGSVLNVDTVAADFNNEYFDLTDVPKLVPIRASIAPGGTIPVYSTAAFSAVDPQFATPYTQNFNLSMTTNLSRRLTFDLRYIGTQSKKQQSTVNLNTNNVLNNPELFQALEMTRRGENAPLFDLMLAGLNLNNNVTTIPIGGGVNQPVAYGPIGTCVTQPAGFNTALGGKDGCGPNEVRQRGSAHLRRNGTFQDDIADGLYVDVANALMGLGSTLPANGAAGGFVNLPDNDPNTPGVQNLPGVTNRRLLRNGCDRLAAGLTNIPTRCFPEDYMVANPQLSTATFINNGNSSNYHSMQTQLTLRPTLGMSLQGTWTWSKNMAVSGAATNPLDRNADYTLAGNDRRHDLRMNGTFELPIGPNKLLLGNSSGFLARLAERWQTSLILNWESGEPEDITSEDMMYDNGVPDIVGPFTFKKGQVRWNQQQSGNPSLHGGTYFGLGPNGENSPFVAIEDPQCAITNVTDSQGYNMFANGDCGLGALALRNPDGTPGQLVFTTPLPGRRGTLGRNVIQNRGEWSLDANISKTFRITESKQIQLRIDTTNVLNHPEPGDPNFDSTSGNFGIIATKTGGRSFQGTVRLTF